MKKSRPISKKEALFRLMKLCSHSEKSSFDVEQKLKIWGLQQHSQEIINQLRKENFLDDSRYVKAFIHDKILINKWGSLKIKYHLFRTGIPGNIIENELSSFDHQLYRKMIFEELQKKKTALKKNTLQTLKTKLYAFGNQRGYEVVYIRNFIDESDAL